MIFSENRCTLFRIMPTRIPASYERRGLRACPNAELFLGPFDMEMNRRMGNAQDRADIGVGLSVHHPFQALDLAGRQILLQGDRERRAAKLSTAFIGMERGQM